MKDLIVALLAVYVLRVLGHFIPGNKANPKSIILDILFVAVFLPNFKETS